MFAALRAGGEKWRETRSRGPDASMANREKYRFAFSCKLLLRSDDQHERGGSGMTAKILIVEESGNPSNEEIDLTPVLSE